MPRDIKAVVFDLGNVLVDVDFGRCLRSWSDSSGISEDVILSRFAIDEPYVRFERGEIDTAAYFAHLRRSLRIELTDAQIEAGWNAVLGEEMPHARRAIGMAKAVGPVYILTNTNAVHEAVWSEKYRDLLSGCDGLFVSSRMGCRKPERPAYTRVIDAAGIAPDKLFFLDDSDENIQGARQAGISARRIAKGENLCGVIAEALKI
ncbi:MAG: HAD family hydrolase [Desulfobacterales bacterium]